MELTSDPWDWETYESLQALYPGGPHPPLTDEEVADAYPDLRWAEDKPTQLKLLGGEDFDDSLRTPNFPYVVRLRRNPQGLGKGFRVGGPVRPGEFWQRLHPSRTHRHWSVDVACALGLLHGPAIWTEGIVDPCHEDRFLAWVVGGASPVPDFGQLDRLSKRFIRELGAGFRGVLNFEFRQALTGSAQLNFLEVHLRPSVEFFPAYGRRVVRQIFGFYAGQAKGLIPPDPGAVLVEPRDSRTLDLRATSWERSWRRRLHYVTR